MSNFTRLSPNFFFEIERRESQKIFCDDSKITQKFPNKQDSHHHFAKNIIFVVGGECHSLYTQQSIMDVNSTQEFTKDELEKIQKGYKRLKDFVYFDSAGAVLYSEDLIKTASEVLIRNLHCNPHTSKTAEDLVEQVRYK